MPFRAELARNPYDFSSNLEISVLLKPEGKLEEARKCLDAALQQFHQELARDSRHVPSLLAIARELERQSQFRKALPYAQHAVAAENGNYAAHDILGRVLVSMDRTQEGLKELETARQIEPGNSQVYFALASAYAKARRSEDAAKARAEFLRLQNLGGTRQ